MHTYGKAEGQSPAIWTVGYWIYAGNSAVWKPIKDFSHEAAAAAFTSYLNGGERYANVEWEG